MSSKSGPCVLHTYIYIYIYIYTADIYDYDYLNIREIEYLCLGLVVS
jgi:hypothetical protein